MVTDSKPNIIIVNIKEVFKITSTMVMGYFKGKTLLTKDSMLEVNVQAMGK